MKRFFLPVLAVLTLCAVQQAFGAKSESLYIYTVKGGRPFQEVIKIMGDVLGKDSSEYITIMDKVYFQLDKMKQFKNKPVLIRKLRDPKSVGQLKEFFDKPIEFE